MEVTLSPKLAKSGKRDRKRHLTGAKARVGGVRKTRADLERQLKACRRQIAHVRERLVDAMKQQTATSQVMHIISNSPIQSVLNAVAENAARVCGANNAEIYRVENNLLRLVASHGEIPVDLHAREGFPVNRDRVIGRATCDRRTIHVRNLAAEENEFPAGSSDAKRQGHRTILATPLLREGAPIGVISIRRWEVRPFYAKQVALLENFADQAVIAIENARLFEAEKQRSLALAQVQAELAHVSRVTTLGQLTASIAHEVTQPIAAARINARAALNFLDAQPPDLGEVREMLAWIVDDADRAGAIIDRIRDHIKKAPPRRERFDLNAAINEVIMLAQSAINKSGVSVQTCVTEEVLIVQGDRVQVQQVLLNLLLNAVEALGSVEAEARELLISAEQDRANGVLVAVRDSGPGIDPRHFERVFEAFYTTKSSGVGIGLSICRSIIDAHGGRLWAEANEPRGAVFLFTLPGQPAF
jgi:C4-dicarboxylate-specific signal transduction histidine kinase